MPECPCVRLRERERGELLNIYSCPANLIARAPLLWYDFIASPTSVKMEVITPFLQPKS